MHKIKQQLKKFKNKIYNYSNPQKSFNSPILRKYFRVPQEKTISSHHLSLLNRRDSNNRSYSRKECHHKIIDFLTSQKINTLNRDILISELKQIPMEEKRVQARSLLDYILQKDYLNWITRKKEDDFDQVDIFSDFYISLCTSFSTIFDQIPSLNYPPSEIQSQIFDLEMKYVQKYEISVHMFNWITDEPISHDCCTIINRLLELFSVKNRPALNDFPIDYFYEQFDIFMTNYNNDVEKYDANLYSTVAFGKSTFVVFMISLMIFQQTENESYKEELSLLFNYVWKEMKKYKDLVKRYFILTKEFSNDHFEILSSSVFSYYH